MTSRFNGSNTILTVDLSSGGPLTYSLAGNLTADNFIVTLVNNGTDSDITIGTGELTISAPARVAVGVGQPDPIAGVGIAESPTTSSETFTVTLSDSDGVLAATGGTQSNGGKTLTVTGSLSQVNADLATLTDTDATGTSDTITISARDSNGGTATPERIAVTVNGVPVITAPASIGVATSRATAIRGVSLFERGDTSNETFTVTLVDTSGDLSASGSGVSGSGTTSLTVTGSLSQVNADLATLTDTQSAASDTITINASDNFGNAASQRQIAVTVNGPLVLTAPASATVSQSQATPIPGISLSEGGNTSSETLTVTLSDNDGLLSATGAGVSGAGTTRLTITSPLSQVNNDLTTLTDTDPTTTSDTITVNASDSIGDQVGPQSIAVTVQPLTLGGLEGIVAVNGVQVINWPSLEASLRPAFIDTIDWNLIWKRYEADVGTTTTSLVNALLPVATTLSQISHTLIGPLQIDVSTLLTEVLEEAAGVLPNIILADTTDLAPAGTGLNLSLTRTYSASFLNRNDPGPFGDGWTFTYRISAVTDRSGNVYITSPSGVELFTLQSNGSYTPQPGDPSKLTLSGGAYVLTGINGTVERFLRDGQIGSITDSNGNTIDVSYGSNGLISGVAGSNGQSLSFTTNTQGRITSATDNYGQTTIYTYDASGDHLLSVSGPDGTTTYSYVSSSNAFTQNGLTQITNPDGTTQNFQYDSQGNLISESGSGGVGPLSYGYPSAGTFTTTDPAGNTATLIFDANGNLAETTDRLGNVTHFQYNFSNEVTGAVAPSGATYAFTYDASANLTGYTDPDGGTVSATYAPGTDLLTSFTDQNGNTTDYSYNSAGDLTGITYDNGSGTSYRYSANGLLTSSTDARGQTTTYTYNAQGLLTKETFSDGTVQAYAYNSQGELISAQATNGGLTTYTYNAARELTSVTNPAGQVESYTYNSGGQKLTRIEPDGSVTQYSYNAAGELSEIKGGSGNLITQYTYNALGEVVGSLDGNGQTTGYTYDADGNVTEILTKAADGTVTSQLNYIYNADGQAITAASLDGTWTYTYDVAGQLTNAVFASTNASVPSQNLTYKYDAAGNRTETIFNGAVNDYTTNGLNQYTSSNGTTYGYDADGNLVSMTKGSVTTTYTYNSQNQLIAESGPSGNFTYQYDALGNLVSSTVNGVVSNYVIDPLAISTSATGPLSAIAQAYNAAGNVSATYDYGNGLAAEITSSGTDYYNTDATGDVTSLSGAGGNLVDTYDYTPFGTLLTSTGSIANPFQYAGGWGITTGTDGLLDMRTRHYDPTTGRFASRDAIGVAGGPSLYAYAGNTPVGLVDPTGLSPPYPGFGTPVYAGSEPVDSEAPPYPGFGTPVYSGSVPIEQSSSSDQVSTILALALLGEATTITHLAAAWAPLPFKFVLIPGELLETYAGWLLIKRLINNRPPPFPQVPLPFEPPNQSTSHLRGDVHGTTYDGLHYDFQAAGEFVLTQSTEPGNSFQVQIRLQPWFTSASVTVMTMIGAAVGTDRVTFGLNRPNAVWIDGSPSALNSTNTVINLNGGSVVQLSSASWKLTWSTGESLTVSDYGSYFNLSVSLGPLDGPGSVQGLAGPDEGQANDFQLADGKVLPQPLTSAQLYGEYANAWRITQANSLLDYAAGQTTATFTDVNFPGDLLSLADLPQNIVNQAAAAVAAGGVTDPNLVADAELDYIATGNTSFITADGQGQAGTTAATITSSAPPAPAVGISAAAISVIEMADLQTPVSCVVYLTRASSGDTPLDWTVTVPGAGYFDASAFGGTLPSGTVTISPGQTSGQFTIEVPANALGTQPSEKLAVEISAPNATPVFSPTAETIVINSQPEPGNAAVPVFEELTTLGTFTQNGNAYTLDLGTVPLSAMPRIQFALANNAMVPADDLEGTFLVTSGSGVGFTGDSGISDLPAGQVYEGLSATLEGGSIGFNSETLTFFSDDMNVSGYFAPLPNVALTIDYSINGPPAIAAPATATVRQNQATAITGVSLAETGNTTGETFTVTLSDTNGRLAATGTGVSGSGTTSLSITGTLAQVNSDLATLTDTDTSTAPDKITLNAGDSFGESATPQSITVTVMPQSGTPVITAPTAATTGVGQPGAITGVGISEAPTTSGESFTAVLADTNGVLSASAAGGATVTPSNGGKTLTIGGTLSQVNAALATLSDSDATAGSDTVTVNASDSNGGTASQKSIAVTVNGLPSITAPMMATVQLNQATAIAGVSVSETGNTTTSGETFTITLSDTNGVLAATGGTQSNGGKSLTIAGSLSQVNSDLGTLTDTDPSTAADAITVNAKDSFGNNAVQQTITVPPQPIAGNAQLDIAPSQTLDLTSALLNLDTPGEPGDTLVLTAVGTTGTRGVVTLRNGDLTYTAPASGSSDAFTYTVTDEELHESATGNVSVALNPSLTGNGTLIFTGSGNIVDVGNGNDQVTVSGDHNTLIVGGGNDQLSITRNNIISAGGGNDTLSLTGNNGTVTLGGGNDNVTVSGTGESITAGTGNDTFTLGASMASLFLHGLHDTVAINGGTDSITATPNSTDALSLQIGALGGTVSVANCDVARGVVLLAQALASAEGWTTSAQIAAALGMDGHGGSLLSLGNFGSIDFQNVPKTQLTASNFHIG